MAYYASKAAALSALNQKKAQVAGLEEKKRLLEEALAGITDVLHNRAYGLRAGLADWRSSLNAFGSFSWEGTRMKESQEVAATAQFEQYAAYVCMLYSWQRTPSEAAVQAYRDLEGARAEQRGLSWQYYSWDSNHPFGPA
jgi:hypothetical protein